jgi:hypothetical protein
MNIKEMKTDFRPVMNLAKEVTGEVPELPKASGTVVGKINIDEEGNYQIITVHMLRLAIDAPSHTKVSQLQQAIWPWASLARSVVEAGNTPVGNNIVVGAIKVKNFERDILWGDIAPLNKYFDPKHK